MPPIPTTWDLALWSRGDISLPLSLSLSLRSPRTNPRTHACRACNVMSVVCNAFHEGVVREIALKVPVHHRRSVSSCRSVCGVIVRKRQPLSFRKRQKDMYVCASPLWIFLTPYPHEYFFQNVFLRANDRWIIYGDACGEMCDEWIIYNL